MASVQKSVLIGYSAAQMFALVDDVERYPEFLPWCGGASVDEHTAEIKVATLHIAYMSVKHSFTTANRNDPPYRIEMTLRDGPFRSLDGTWIFQPLAEDACKVIFELHYEFSSHLLEKLVGPVFSQIANSFVDAFVKRAEAIYG